MSHMADYFFSRLISLLTAMRHKNDDDIYSRTICIPQMKISTYFSAFHIPEPPCPSQILSRTKPPRPKKNKKNRERTVMSWDEHYQGNCPNNKDSISWNMYFQLWIYPAWLNINAVYWVDSFTSSSSLQSANYVYCFSRTTWSGSWWGSEGNGCRRFGTCVILLWFSIYTERRIWGWQDHSYLWIMVLILFCRKSI